MVFYEMVLTLGFHGMHVNRVSLAIVGGSGSLQNIIQRRQHPPCNLAKADPDANGTVTAQDCNSDISTSETTSNNGRGRKTWCWLAASRQKSSFDKSVIYLAPDPPQKFAASSRSTG